MPISFMPDAPNQDLLLPHSLRDWLPSGHLSNYIIDTVDAPDLRAFFVRYEVGGPRNQPSHPAIMVKVLVYGYATGVFSSRKIASPAGTRKAGRRERSGRAGVGHPRRDRAPRAARRGHSSGQETA